MLEANRTGTEAASRRFCRRYPLSRCPSATGDAPYSPRDHGYTFDAASRDPERVAFAWVRRASHHRTGERFAPCARMDNAWTGPDRRRAVAGRRIADFERE